MTTNKEKNFISAVVYLHNDGVRAVKFFKMLTEQLDAHFEQYELIAVDDACTDDTIPMLRDWAKDLDKPLTFLHMSLFQRLEPCMNAGLDASIGDYVYEFDTTDVPYPADMIFAAYQTAMTGSDLGLPQPHQRHQPAVLRGVQCQFPLRLPAAHRRLPPGLTPCRQPGARFQRASALPQGGLRCLRPENDRPDL